jgi:hypothetical protein
MFRFAAVVASDSRGVCEIGAQPLDGQTRWLRTAVSYWLKNGYHVSAPHFPHAVLLARPRTVAESHMERFWQRSTCGHDHLATIGRCGSYSSIHLP